MKTTLFLAVVMLATVSTYATPQDDMVILDAQMSKIEGPAGDDARRRIAESKYPSLPGETSAETSARRAILMQRDAMIEMRERLKKEGKLTPEIELQIMAQLNQLAAQLAALATPAQTIIIQDR